MKVLAIVPARGDRRVLLEKFDTLCRAFDQLDGQCDQRFEIDHGCYFNF